MDKKNKILAKALDKCLESTNNVENKKETPSFMETLRMYVDIPEEFKFTDKNTFYTMLRNIYRGKSDRLLWRRNNHTWVSKEILRLLFAFFNVDETLSCEV